MKQQPTQVGQAVELAQLRTQLKVLREQNEILRELAKGWSTLVAKFGKLNPGEMDAWAIGYDVLEATTKEVLGEEK